MHSGRFLRPNKAMLRCVREGIDCAGSRFTPYSPNRQRKNCDEFWAAWPRPHEMGRQHRGRNRQGGFMWLRHRPSGTIAAREFRKSLPL